jgi:antitoxin PrlF
MAEESISMSRLTSKYQATIPRPVREHLAIGAGDGIAFVIENDRVFVRRAEPLDHEYSRALSDTLGEWLSAADEEAYIASWP